MSYFDCALKLNHILLYNFKERSNYILVANLFFLILTYYCIFLYKPLHCQKHYYFKAVIDGNMLCILTKIFIIYISQTLYELMYSYNGNI